MSTAQTIAALAVAPAVLLALWQRRRLRREGVGLVLLGAAALAVYASGLLHRLPNLDQAVEGVARGLGAGAYALVGGLSFLETGAFVGFLVPGEFTVILGGVIAGDGEISLIPLIAVVWLCTWAGDSVSFLVGRRLGRGFLLRHGSRLRVTSDRLDQVERYLERHGGATIVVGRFASFVRSLAPFVVGTTRLPYWRFLPYSLIGTGLWATTFCVLGFVFYRSFDTVAAVAEEVTLAFGVAIVVAVVAVVAFRRLRSGTER